MEPPAYPKNFKRTHSAVILACLFSYGLTYAILGGTLDDLQDIYHMTANGVSQILVTRSAGALAGSFISGGFLYKHVDAKIAIALSLLAGGLGTAIVPDFAPDFWIAHAGQFVTGFSFGALEVGANVWLVQLWGDGIDPIMQSYHVSFGVGSFVGPLITTPFLGPGKNHTLNATMDERFENFELDPELPASGTSRIAIPYGVFGGAYASMGFVILLLKLFDRSALRQHYTLETNDAAQRSVIRFEWTVVSLLSAFVVAEALCEVIMGSMLPLYVMRDPNLAMDKTEANYLLSFYYATFLAGRIASIFVSFKLKPNSSLIIAQAITAVGTLILLLLVFPAVSGRVTAWLATGMIGFGLGPLYPTAFTWTVRYIHLKYAHMSAALIAACLGGLLPTYLVAPWVESSINVMPAVTVGGGIFLTCILAAMLFTTRNRCPIYDQEDEDILVEETKE